MVPVRRHARDWLAYAACGGLVLTCLGAAPVQLFNPSPPSATEIKQPPKNVTTNKAQEPERDERGTPQAPFIVRVAPSPKSAEETAQDQTERKEKTSADHWMIFLTGALVFVGVIQGIVFWIQAGRLKATINKMDEVAAGQSDDMARYTEQATKTAKAMEDLAWEAKQQTISASNHAESAEATTILTRTMSESAAKQVTLAEERLAGHERPRIYIFGLRFVETDPGQGESPTRTLVYFVANYGRTAAIIENVETGATDEAGLAIEENHVLLTEIQSHPLFVHPILPPNVELPPVVFEIPAFFNFETCETEDRKAYMKPVESSFYVRIKITYRGPTTRDHFTNILWRWNETTGSYVTSNDRRYAVYDGEGQDARGNPIPLAPGS